jgi:hypothetical protein
VITKVFVLFVAVRIPPDGVLFPQKSLSPAQLRAATREWSRMIRNAMMPGGPHLP